MKKPLAVIIEDEMQHAQLITLILQAEGYTVSHFADGLTAIEELAQIEPALIMLDVNLPEVAGDEVLKWIRGQAHLQDTKVIVITAYVSRVYKFNPRTTLVLLKPFTLEELQQMVTLREPPASYSPASETQSEPSLDQNRYVRPGVKMCHFGGP